MNSADVIKMLNAGFTREEILNMATAPAADTQPAPAADPQPAPAPSWDRLMQEFADLKRAVQAGNRNAAQQPAPVTMDGETVLANIIAPTKNQK